MSKTRNTRNIIRALKIGVGAATALFGAGLAFNCAKELKECESAGIAGALLGPGFAGGFLFGTASAYSGAHVAYSALKHRPARPMEKAVTLLGFSALGIYGIYKIDDYRYEKSLKDSSKPKSSSLPAPKNLKP